MVEQQESQRREETKAETGDWSPVRKLNLSNVQHVGCYSTPLYSSDWVRAGRSGDRVPVGWRNSAPVLTGPGAHPASNTMGSGSFQGVKRSGCGINHTPPPHLAPRLKKE